MILTRNQKGMELSHSELDNNLLEIENLFKNSTCSISARGPIGDIGLTGMDGAIISEEAPINPDLNPVATTWVQVDYVNNVVVDFFHHINGLWKSFKNKKFSKIFAGAFNSIYVDTDGNTFISGTNFGDQLGLGTNTGISIITPFPEFNNLKLAYIGHQFIIIVKQDGTVWAAGDNASGQLGLGHNTRVSVFTQLPPFLNNPRKITGGHVFSAIESSTGELFGAGYRWPLGLAADTNTFQSLGVSNLIQISGGGHNLVIVKNDGTIHASGSNDKGQKGLGNTTYTLGFSQLPFSNPLKVKAGWGEVIYILKSDNILIGAGDGVHNQLGAYINTSIYYSTFQTLLTGALDIDGGLFFAIAKKMDNSLVATGYNADGQLGLGYSSPDIGNWTEIYAAENIDLSLVCGGFHSFALKNNGDLLGWGHNGSNQITNELSEQLLIPTLVKI